MVLQTSLAPITHTTHVRKTNNQGMGKCLQNHSIKFCHKHPRKHLWLMLGPFSVAFYSIPIRRFLYNCNSVQFCNAIDCLCITDYVYHFCPGGGSLWTCGDFFQGYTSFHLRNLPKL